MPENELWTKLLNPSAVKAGWHLSRHDMRTDFIEDINFTEAVANNLNPHVDEIVRRLATDTYKPKPLISIEIPKGSLAVRPGSFIELHDRIVLFSIVKLLVPILDKELPENVWSYRYREAKNRRSLFYERDILDIPFLKGRTIAKYIEPFDPWYALWPMFDQKSREALLLGYDHLVVSDISAYFENINLEILRALLYRRLPSEQKIVNTLVEFLEGWAIQTDNGFRPRRGIPQGSAISSFIGNIFLLPLDDCFTKLEAEYDIRYYRYMDDVRIFCKDQSVARKMVFRLDETIRKLHLNLQGAKTKILLESDGDITKYLVDERVDYLKDVRAQIQIDKTLLKEPKRSKLRAELWSLARSRGRWSEFERLVGNRKPLTGLTLRAFRMWLSLLLRIRDDDYINPLFNELQRNPDQRLTLAFQTAARSFPRHSRIPLNIYRFLTSPLNIFPHQAAELVRALRYPSRLSAPLNRWVVERICNVEDHFYLRVQCCHLTGRMHLSKDERRRIRRAFASETNELVLSAMLVPLAQLEVTVSEKTHRFMLHANERVSILGRYLHQLTSNAGIGKSYLDFVFSARNPMNLCDHIGYLWYFAGSQNAEILSHFLKTSASAAKKHIVMDVRDRLKEMRIAATVQLAVRVALP